MYKTRIDYLFEALSRSKFRRKFLANEQELQQLSSNFDQVLTTTRTLLQQRLGAAHPKNDGKQTPYHSSSGCPCFVAQHATATCCRACLAKWHKIKQGVELTDPNLDYMVSVIKRWYQTQLPSLQTTNNNNSSAPDESSQLAVVTGSNNTKRRRIA